MPKAKPRSRREPVPVARKPAPPSPRRRALERWLAIAVVVAVTGVGFWLRVSAAAPDVFPAKDEVRLFDTDPYYHVRHATYAATHFPHLLRWDPSVYPAGLPALYVGLFDLTIASASLVAGGGHADPALVERVAAWTPPVIGVLVSLAVFWLGVVCLGWAGGALAAVLLFLDPGLYANRSLLGYPDHHVAEVLLGVLTVVGLVRCVQRARAGRPRSPWRPAVLLALPMSLFLFTWYGAPIYLVLVGVTLFLAQSLDIGRGAGGEAIGRAALRWALGLLVVVVPAALLVPWLVMEAGFFVKTVVAAVLLGGGLPIYALVARAAIERLRVRPAIVAVGGLVVVFALLAVAVAVVPGGHYLLHELVGAKTVLVREQAAIDAGTYLYLGGTPAVLALLALPLGVVAAARGRDRRDALVPLLLGAIVVALWLQTHDYGYAAPAYLSILAAYVVVAAVRALRAPAARVAAAAAVAVAVVLPIWPLGKVVPPQRGAESLRGLMILDDGWVHALRWLRDHTPPPTIGPTTTIPADPGFRHPPGDVGVLAFWDFGHYVAAIGERLPFTSGAISKDVVSWFLLEDEEQAASPEALRLKRDERVGYVIVDVRTANDFFMAGLQMAGRPLGDYRDEGRKIDVGGQKLKIWSFAGHYARTMVARLYRDAGHDLGHFRLVYDSPDKAASFSRAEPEPGRDATRVTRQSRIIADATVEGEFKKAIHYGRPVAVAGGVVYDVAVGPAVRIFEIVKGARLEGTAEPGAVVEAALDVRAAAARSDVHYVRTALAGEDGRFELVVPYPTEPASDSDVNAIGLYTVTSRGRVLGRVPVTVSDVRAGAPVKMP